LFVVAEAPRDYYIVSEPEIVGWEATTTDLDLAGKDGAQNTVARLKLENERLRHEKMELERYGFTQHRLLIRIEGEFRQYKNEFRGVLSRTRDVSKLVLEELLTVLSAHTEIEEAVSEYRKRPWIQITIGLAVLILGIFGMYEYGYNADFRTGVSNNALLIGVLAVCCVFLAMFMFGRRRGRNQ
jgi:cation transport ATPase